MKRPARKPEILAPAGSPEALAAALSTGADAVYFGLQTGFNARARAANFPLSTLPETVARIHRAGARAYLTMNTLVFEAELPGVERVLRDVAAAGIDALIVQDPAVALLARAVCPTMEIHASTQMTISSADGATFARSLGATRVVLPRELSVASIGKMAAETDIELEVFIHGAQCVSWSGQCLSSEAWGGRSANRGECAQSCRMPYDLMVDGERRDLGDVQYLLSPKDLAGMRAVEDLVNIGVHGLKIEGRQKGPHYVATAVAGYRAWVDAVATDGGPTPRDTAQARADLGAMTVAYSRGFGDGFLAGSDHQSLVEGRFPKHRGAYIGRVTRVQRDDVWVDDDPAGRPWTGARALAGGGARGVQDGDGDAPLGAVSSPLPGMGGDAHAASGPAAPALDLKPGMGIGFDLGHPEDKNEPGGPLYRVTRRPGGWLLGFGRPGPDLEVVTPGTRVWLTSDPAIARVTSQAVDGPERSGGVALALIVSGSAGTPLTVTATVLASRHAPTVAGGDIADIADIGGGGGGGTSSHASQPATTASTRSLLSPATHGGLDAALLRDKLGALGGTPFALAALDSVELAPGLHVPVSELKTVRRALVDALLPMIERGAMRPVTAPGALARLRAELDLVPPAASMASAGAGSPGADVTASDAPPELLLLCRTDDQLSAAIAAGLRHVELDWMEMVGLGRAVARARAAGMTVTLATVRVQHPGEESYDSRLAALAPDAVLVRHWGALVHFGRAASPRPVLHGDFSLNVTNSITAAHLLRHGLATVTAAYDLDSVQLFALLDGVPAARVTVAVQHRIPTFHTEHCVYAHTLSAGRDYHTCGRPCDTHQVGLRDHAGATHPVIVDVACRNTVFNGSVQAAASIVPQLLARGVRRFRVELVRESSAETSATISAWEGLFAGRLTPAQLVSTLGVEDRYGVTPGRMEMLV